MNIIKALCSKLIKTFRLYLYRCKWRNLNKHNFTDIDRIFPFEKVVVGKYTYGTLCIHTYGNPKESVRIGNFCSIAANVTFITGGEHSSSTLSTYPFKNKLLSEKDFNFESKTKGPIVVSDDVWIGHGSIILSGVNIGQGAIIGAGSVVASDVPPYAIFAGNRVIKYRFTEDVINRLLSLDYSKFDVNELQKHSDYLYRNPNLNTISELQEKIFKL